jgi:putative tricarboxylic transport membrane protein
VITSLSKQGKGELAFAGSLVLLGLIVFRDTFHMEIPQGNNIVSPRTFPYMTAGLVTVVGVALIVEVLRGRLGMPEGDESAADFKPADRRTMLLFMAAVAVHVVLLEKAGYIISATLGFWGIAYTFGSRKPLKDFAISFIFSVVVYFTFSRGLQIQFPEGFLEKIFAN